MVILGVNTVFPKFNYVRSNKLRNSARGQECTMRIPTVCTGDPATTVWAHSNLGIHGKGKGIKATDVMGAYMCFACHAAYDGRIKCIHIEPETMDLMFYQAMALSLLKLIDQGIINVEGA